MVYTNCECNSLSNTGSSNSRSRYPWRLAFGALASGALMGLANNAYHHNRHHHGYNYFGHHGGYIYSDAFGRIERGGCNHYYNNDYYGFEGFGNSYWGHSNYYDGYGNDLRYLLDDITYGDYDYSYNNNLFRNNCNCNHNKNSYNNFNRLRYNNYDTDDNVINCNNLNVFFVNLGEDTKIIENSD